MADVDRGQLFLVGAFALAVLFVALAVLLNAAIFTENLSTQGRASSPGDAVEYREAVVDVGGRSVEGVNYRNNSSYTDLETALDRGVDTWSVATAKHRASQGHAANVSVVAVTRGTRLTQDAERNFTNDDGDADWTVAEDVHLRNFTMNVSQSSLEGNSVLPDVLGYRNSDYLRVEFEDDDGENWTVYVHQNGGNVSVEVIDDSDTLPAASCEVDPGADGYAVVDFTGAAVGGRDCDALDFFGDMDEPYTVRVERALDGGSETGVGTYSLVVDEEESSLSTVAEFEDDGATGQPYYTPAVYATTLELHYRAPDTDYEARVRVAPGEPDA